jgi:hypothetical protein
MKKELILLIFTMIFNFVWAQPTITNAEDFQIGTVLKFQKCDPTNVDAGIEGANQTWDFSTLSTIPDTATEWIVSPSSTTNGSLFPTANLVVKVSNGQFTYVNKTEYENNIVGFIDTTSTFPATHYTNPLVIAKRPLNYGTIFTDTFTIQGSPALGVVTIDPDAYGTLILPNGIHNDVLRVKISQNHPWFTYSIYAWFDGVTKSALLKIDDQPNVEYLLSEEIVSSISEFNKQKTFKFYPNPTIDQIAFESEDTGELIITNNLGQVVLQTPIKNKQTNISTATLKQGVYHLIFVTRNHKATSELIIQR